MAASLQKQSLDYDNIEDEYCHAIFMVEMELGHYIDDEYPITKFLEELNELRWYKEEEKKQLDGIK